MSEEYTPMMRQYLETKEEYKDCILFYRLGDFYEMFFDDAIKVSRELELTLTKKSCGTTEKAPMCGVPFHAADSYIARLIHKGYKVAICEQVEDPKEAKGLVKREVIRIVTPGTAIDQAILSEDDNNYILCVHYLPGQYGMAFCDVSTGEFVIILADTEQKARDELARYNPSEVIANDGFMISPVYTSELYKRYGVPVSLLEAAYFNGDEARKRLREQFGQEEIDPLYERDMEPALDAASALLRYLKETQMRELFHIRHITLCDTGSYMLIDTATHRNLELVETMRDKEKKGSLLWVLDHTRTAMGARLLKSYVEQPLTDRDEINRRLDAVSELVDNMIPREELREYLGPVYDLERIITRISYRTANPRDLIAFKNSLSVLPGIRVVLSDLDSQALRELYTAIDELRDLYELVENAISDEAPISVHDGDILKPGYNEEVDKLRHASRDGKGWLAELETRERDKTGIKKLRVKYNRVFGYYIEVTNSFKDMVPEYYERKQTLANAERYSIPELKEMEQTILGAEDRLTHLEYELYQDILLRIAGQTERIQATAHALARLDVYLSLALCAVKENYKRPLINTEGYLRIKKGRHPVVEKMLDKVPFIENDTYLDMADDRIAIITGPNMAGKSTYMRQVALIVLMAQMGSFVPAEEADIGICDRIFTRVGASDDLASGQSTFMVEMNEVANILKNATDRSLLILDEIGRGTSTYDGLAIAWAVVEHISNREKLGAKTLFATHYHELTELEGKLSGVHNFCIAVKEDGDDIIFLRRIIPGGADKSYGIQVARLAGVPDEVLSRAKEIVSKLSGGEESLSDASVILAGEHTKDSGMVMSESEKRKDIKGQIKFDIEPRELSVRNEIMDLNLSEMTPIEAMVTLSKLQEEIRRES